MKNHLILENVRIILEAHNYRSGGIENRRTETIRDSFINSFIHLLLVNVKKYSLFEFNLLAISNILSY